MALREQDPARAAAAMRSRPGAVHPLAVARVPGTPPHPAVAGEALARLRPLFEGGVVTAGNASQISDGGSAVVMMRRLPARTTRPMACNSPP